MSFMVALLVFSIYLFFAVGMAWVISLLGTVVLASFGLPELSFITAFDIVLLIVMVKIIWNVIPSGVTTIKKK